MTVLLPVIVPAIGAAAVAAIGHRRRLAVAIGCLALAASLLAAFTVGPSDTLAIGGSAFAPTDYGRLAYALLATSGLLLAGVAVAARDRPGGLAALLAGLAGAWIALVVPDPVIATWAILAAGVAAFGGARLADGSADPIAILSPAIRAVVIAGAVGVAGISLATSAAGGPVPDPIIGGVAFVLVAGSLALRAAAVPLHSWAARLADGAPLPAVAASLAWLPAVAIVVGLAWSDSTATPIVVELGVERGLLIVVALITLALASLAATLAEDVGHVAAYLAIAGSGVALLGIAAIDPAVWAPTRSWLVMTAVAMSGLAAWAVALAGAYDSRWLPDLDGWARRSPALGVALALVGVALVGFPGSAVLDARSALVDATVEGPLSVIARLLLVAPLVAVLRVLVVGLGPIGSAVRDGRSERPLAPESWAAREAVTPSDRIRAVGRDALTVWRLDRVPAASAIALVAAVLALAVAAGGFDLATAAAGPAPGIEGPAERTLEPGDGAEPGASEQPGGSEAPDTSEPGASEQPGGSEAPDTSEPGASQEPAESVEPAASVEPGQSVADGAVPSPSEIVASP